MNLTIDIGNTSAKIAVFDGANVVFFERVATDWQSEIAKLCRMFYLRACAVSNVAGKNAELELALKQLPFAPLMLSDKSPEAQPYFQRIPRGLGADRLAADIAAVRLSEGRPFLVIDAGTCLTFDVVDAQRSFVGGSISPGIALRLRAMHEHTAALPLIAPEGELPDFGYDTVTALRSGAANGVKYEIEGYIRMCLRRFPDLRVYYTGGNQLHFSDDVSACITSDPMLVLRGLNELLAARSLDEE